MANESLRRRKSSLCAQLAFVSADLFLEQFTAKAVAFTALHTMNRVIEAKGDESINETAFMLLQCLIHLTRNVTKCYSFAHLFRLHHSLS